MFPLSVSCDDSKIKVVIWINGIAGIRLVDIQNSMNGTDPDRYLYRSFAAVLREGSLSAGARTLGLTQPTLSRHIDELEHALGMALFVCAPRGLEPTGTP